MGAATAAISDRKAGRSLRGMTDEMLQSKMAKFSKFKGKGGFFGKMYEKFGARYQSEIDRRAAQANAQSAMSDMQGNFNDLGSRVSNLETKMNDLSQDPTSIESAIENPVAEEPVAETPTVGAPTPGGAVGSFRRTPKINTVLETVAPSTSMNAIFPTLTQKSANAIYGSELQRKRSLKR